MKETKKKKKKLYTGVVYSFSSLPIPLDSEAEWGRIRIGIITIWENQRTKGKKERRKETGFKIE